MSKALSQKNISVLHLTKVASLVAIYFITAWVGLKMDAVSGFATLVWPPTGIALAALLLYGCRLWPGVALGAISANLITGAPFLVACGMGLGNTLEAVLGAYLLQRILGFHKSLDRMKDVIGLVILAGCLSTVVSSTIGVTSLWLGNVVPSEKFGITWRAWWIGDILGDLIIAPLILIWFSRSWPNVTGWKKIAEVILLSLSTIGVCLFVFGRLHEASSVSNPLPIVFFPFIIISVIRFGQIGTVTTTFIVSVLAIWGTANGLGPFAHGALSENLLSLHSFLAAIAVTGILLASAIAETKNREEALRKSDALKTSILEASLDCIIMMDHEGKIREFNPAAETTFGYARDEVIGKEMADFIVPPKFRMPHRRGLAKYLATGQGPALNKRLELVGMRKGGIEFPVELTITRIQNYGQPMFSGSLRDLTERKRDEQALFQNRAQLQAAFQAMSDGVMIFDMNGRAVLANAAQAQLCGYSNTEDMQQDVAYFIEIYEIMDLEGIRLPYSEWPISRVLKGERLQGLELRAKRLDTGTQWILSFSGEPVFDEKGGQMLAVITTRDITQVKQGERNLLESEAQFRTLANSIPQLCWMANKDGWIFWYNQRWYDYTGTSLQEMEGWGWEKVHDPVELKRMSVSWKNSLESGQPWEDTFPLKSKTGEWRWFLSRALPMRNHNGEITFWFGTNTDINDQLRIERELKESKEVAERANLAKTQFLANMSHEIRTPIGAIIGFTDLLKSPTASTEEKNGFMQVITRNSQNLLRLIDDILDLSKVEAGKIALEKNGFLFPDFLAHLSSLMTLKASEKGITFSLKIEGLVPDQICTDQLRLRQILTNIVGNAIKFTDVGTVLLIVANESPLLKFTVIDTGPGIPAENREKLFRPFGQADASTTRKFGGTGLGLVLSKRLTHALGGDLILSESEVGKGSKFVATIEPIGVKGAKMVSNEKLKIANCSDAAYEDRGGRLAGLRVLLVEDSPDNRTLVSLYLGNTGAHLETADDGLAGYNQAINTSPDVVLIDIQMPIMDGHTATRKLRGSGFSKPIIALTAHAMREERDKCFESGCTDYLTKPILRKTLIDVLERYLPV